MPLSVKELKALAKALVETVTNPIFMREPFNWPKYKYLCNHPGQLGQFLESKLKLELNVRGTSRLRKNIFESEDFSHYQKENFKDKNFSQNYTSTMKKDKIKLKYIDQQLEKREYIKMTSKNKKKHKDIQPTHFKTNHERIAKNSIKHCVGLCSELCFIMITLLSLVKIPGSDGSFVCIYCYSDHLLLLLSNDPLYQNEQSIIIVDPWIKYSGPWNDQELWREQQKYYNVESYYTGELKPYKNTMELGQLRLSDRHYKDKLKRQKYLSIFAPMINYFCIRYANIIGTVTIKNIESNSELQWTYRCKLCNKITYIYKDDLCKKCYVSKAIGYQ